VKLNFIEEIKKPGGLEKWTKKAEDVANKKMQEAAQVLIRHISP